MFGLMQAQPLLVSSLIRHAARYHARAPVVSRNEDGSMHRTTYVEVERRARMLAAGLRGLGVERSDRVGTLAWNGHRHLEAYYAISGMGAVCHTINPRLAPDDIAYILDHAGDTVLLADPGFAPLLARVLPLMAGKLRAVVYLGVSVPDGGLPGGVPTIAYEDLLAGASDDWHWPELDEALASSLCYSNGLDSFQ